MEVDNPAKRIMFGSFQLKMVGKIPAAQAAKDFIHSSALIGAERVDGIAILGTSFFLLQLPVQARSGISQSGFLPRLLSYVM